MDAELQSRGAACALLPVKMFRQKPTRFVAVERSINSANFASDFANVLSSEGVNVRLLNRRVHGSSLATLNHQNQPQSHPSLQAGVQ